ncbi:hypothetical protein KO317_02605 [Candidatus Micrarchaeota archaeon]|nr:hypothetical protein [Candidatus Micrarchaeota archaeon]
MKTAEIMERIAKRDPAIIATGNHLICNPRNPKFLKEYLKGANTSNNFQRLLTFMRKQWDTANEFNCLADEFEKMIPDQIIGLNIIELNKLHSNLFEITKDFYTSIPENPSFQDYLTINSEFIQILELINVFSQDSTEIKGYLIKERIKKIEEELDKEATIFFKTFTTYARLAKYPQRHKLGLWFDKITARREASIYGKTTWAYEIAEAHANGLLYLIDKFGYPEWDSEKVDIFSTEINNLKQKRIGNIITRVSNILEKTHSKFIENVNLIREIFTNAIIKKIDITEKRIGSKNGYYI